MIKEIALRLPDTMIAMAISRPGPPDVLQPESRPVPLVGPQEILIQVVAAGVNRPDVFQRQGSYPPPKGASDLPGLEVSGFVAARGAETKRYAIGDKVCALTPGGGYASYVSVPEVHALPIPSGLDFIEAACVPETFFTVWHNLFQRAALKANEVLLVHGGTSGIGTTAIMMAKAFGATVIATAGNDKKCAACLALGAHHAINYLTTDYVEAVQAFTQDHGADVILDMVGGDYIERNYQAGALDGRVIQVSLLKGFVAEVNFRLMMLKRLTHMGSTLRPQSIQAKARIAEELEAHIWPLVAKGDIRPKLDQIFPLSEAAKAHMRMESSQHIGKIALRVSSDIN